MADATPHPDVQICTSAPIPMSSQAKVLVKVTPPEGAERAASDIVCVIDISGSMGAQATIQTDGGAAESNGLSMLDIAKHGVRTVLKTLSAEDRLSVVWFNHSAGTLFELTAMDEEGQKKATEELEKLGEGGGTNIWEGLKQGLEELRKPSATGPEAVKRLGHVMLLTDGQTTNRNSVLLNLTDYRDKYERLPGTVSAFGFGYNIDSPLLCELAAFGEGIYNFIPDAGFVGTVFVNTMSNLLVTMATEVCLQLAAEDGCEIEEVHGQCRTDSTASGTQVILGTLQYGQTRDVVISMKVDWSLSEFLTAQLTYRVAGGEKVETKCVEGGAGGDDAGPRKVEVQAQRCAYVDGLAAAIKCAASKEEGRGLPAAQELVRELVLSIQASPASDEESVKGLLEDAAGQSTEALSREDWYNKWGVHYLPSIMFAHQTQQCNNFKDPGVQFYGGKRFKEVQEIADDLFCTLPAPKPRNPPGTYGGVAAPGMVGAGPVSMAAYHNPFGGCVDEACMAELVGGGRRQLGKLAKGDVVAAPDGAAAEVVCVVRTACPGGRANLVELEGGCRLTPFHPVRAADGRWAFPAELAVPEERPCSAVCGLVLRGAPALLVGGVPVVALGHGLTEGAARHAYYGTGAVLADLVGAPGFADGRVELVPGSEVRDPATGLVCGLRF